ncbi:ribonuclease e : Ribonuclease G and E OS=Singulisphaera acidiphila (strain ATCC BAA-1392 / DSM 18658 / VKM B-2454 / MOB10) GN=Sinac_3259 PE=4 SV=1: S1: RNase_E_G [Gemmataceae bacterium]|nr:ribonuclease e : Ribonuclease G and E OS=Singulisphaera acidiphila (strain ATCC BAA-1392 / DSM 18658 / VKM B-2454 / MOB10) GN=Sinac_3259 PE=4 SV=1: S1: RNase_E_G [Gemmataceae bacterium]VTU01101.1 ribonuclease e : Ribonuclease G and E OS=Singulisphaera acidiphila (strain ATCC BAA-1392 / DSM 18658 / VKM B-2454 / MOB10) GN=Sinac_3259 PE=4 SV=1: S1: RNase_E_G [Gemmataceae bacterium]
MKKEMLINVLQPEECRIAIVEDGVLEELYVERSSQESYVGNIYKGRIVNIEGSIQAAFVDFGIGRNGFLHVSDVDPAYYKHLMSKDDLAEYEAELDREYGARPAGDDKGRGGRDRGGRGGDRGGRGDRGPRQPQPMTSWLDEQPPQPAARRAPPPPDSEYDEEFTAGLDEETELPLAEEVEEADAVEEEAEAEAAVAPHRAPEPRPVPKPVGKAAPVVDDEDDFAAGLDEVPAPPAPVAARPQPATPAVIARKPAPPPADEDDDFGAGITDEDAAPAPRIVVPATPAAAPAPAEVEPAEAEAEATEPAEAAEAEPKKKPRTRKAKPKADEAAEPAAEATEPATEDKPKAKPRRGKKKTDGDADGDEPKVMGGAERRTSGDDEFEVKPFFDDNDFDPDAPNDRFAGAPAPRANGDDDDEHETGFAADPETADEAEEDARETAQDEERFGPADEAGAAEGAGVGRGFNDDFEDRKRDRGDRNDRGGGGRGGRDRDRGGRGGDRGGRGGDRDRDRGPRGDRNDRGPRTGGPGGFKGGPKGGRDRGMPKPPIEQIFKRGQEVLVQVIKEAVGTKGPTLSTYISIAGRYLVLMPSLNRVGVSRKIEDHEARRRLREILTTLAPPKGVGFIVRTAAVDRDARELRNDLAYLLRLWQVVVKRIKRVSGPVEIYRESDMITRTIRDIFTNDIDTIWVDEPTAFAHASEFLQIVMPKFASRIRYFESTEPLFHKYGVEDEIAKIHQKRIEMPLGGSLVIEQTEALVAIDVNSGSFRAENAEETMFQMNMHAAREIARQLRLRDLGGVIVNDFIDMRSEAHRRKVEDAFRDALRRDRARTKILRISQFGLIEMTRQRIRPSLKRSIFADCPHCRGSGFVKTSESLSIEVMRLVQLAAHRAPAIASIQVGVHTDVAHYLLNKRRKELAGMEERGKLEIQVTGQAGVSPDTMSVRCFDHNGNEVRLLPPAPLPRLSGGKFPGGGRNDRGRDRDDRGRGDRDRRDRDRDRDRDNDRGDRDRDRHSHD